MYKEIWLVMISCGIILLLIALLLSFIWGIPGLIDEISGRKAKRRIKMMRELNYNTGTIDRLNTNEIYSGISTGGSEGEEFANMDVEIGINPSFDVFNKKDDEVKEDVEKEDIESVAEEEEYATSYLSSEESTGFIGEDSSDLSLNAMANTFVIEVLEEQSSL